MTILVAPTEPPALKRIGQSSGLPERYGVDFMWSVEGGLCGVQRKEVSDLLASIRDGRLHKEVAQMQVPQHKMLIIEGQVRWTNDGMLMHQYVTLSKKALNKMLFSVRARDIWVHWTASMQETADAVVDYYEWTQKDEHVSLVARPGPVSPWGKTTNKDYAIHVLTSFPGVGSELAARILKHFGKVPLAWEVSVKDLMEVPGIGKVKAQRLMEALDG